MSRRFESCHPEAFILWVLVLSSQDVLAEVWVSGV